MARTMLRKEEDRDDKMEKMKCGEETRIVGGYGRIDNGTSLRGTFSTGPSKSVSDCLRYCIGFGMIEVGYFF